MKRDSDIYFFFACRSIFSQVILRVIILRYWIVEEIIITRILIVYLFENNYNLENSKEINVFTEWRWWLVSHWTFVHIR